MTANTCVVTNVVASSCQAGRPRQEDRFYARTGINTTTSTSTSSSISFFGIWDGTVCPLAADYVHTRCCTHHLNVPSFPALVDRLCINEEAAGGDHAKILADQLRNVINEAYAATDADLLAECRRLSNHYSSTTSVTALVAGGYLAVGNLGDSPLFLIRRSTKSGAISGTQITMDHKPDQPIERARIEESGGSVQYLHRHNYKPFIRGGDFDRRKATGESAMQLQYSRALGGKDLKPYGLSAEPSIVIIPLDKVEGKEEEEESLVGMILCSDGISDVASPDDAANIVAAAWANGDDAASRLVSWGVARRQAVGMDADNCTAMVVSFGYIEKKEEGGKEGVSSSILLQSADYPNNCTQ